MNPYYQNTLPYLDKPDVTRVRFGRSFTVTLHGKVIYATGSVEERESFKPPHPFTHQHGSPDTLDWDNLLGGLLPPEQMVCSAIFSQ